MILMFTLGLTMAKVNSPVHKNTIRQSEIPLCLLQHEAFPRDAQGEVQASGRCSNERQKTTTTTKTTSCEKVARLVNLASATRQLG